MSKQYGMTFMGNVRHIRRHDWDVVSVCGRTLCDDLTSHDEYPEHRTCIVCERVMLMVARQTREKGGVI